jgi:hypothetical protein
LLREHDERGPHFAQVIGTPLAGVRITASCCGSKARNVRDGLRCKAQSH